MGFFDILIGPVTTKEGAVITAVTQVILGIIAIVLFYYIKHKHETGQWNKIQIKKDKDSYANSKNNL